MNKFIQSFEQACEVMGYDPKAILPDLSAMPVWLQKFTVAKIKLAVIAAAMNKGKVIDWQNSNQWKYYPWFNMRNDNSSGLGLSFGGDGYVNSISGVGSRLCFLTRDEAVHFGTHFIELHADAMVIPQNESAA